MGQVRCSIRGNDSMIGRNRKARDHEQHCGGGTGRRKQPTTQACFKVREWVGHGQTRGLPQCQLICRIVGGSGQTVLCWTRSASLVRRHAERNLLFLVIGRGSRTGPVAMKVDCWVAFADRPVVHTIMHSLWITLWMDGVRCSGANRTQGGWIIANWSLGGTTRDRTAR